MYDLRRLRSLCAIADHGSLTAAAAALDFTQPAVSQHLAALEAEVGAPLVARSRGEAGADPAGALLVEHARAALDRLALAELQVADLVEREQRRVRLAAPLLGADPARPARGRRPPPAPARRRGHDPRVRAAEGARQLLRRATSTSPSVPPRGTRDRADVDERALLEESMYAVVPRAHPLARREARSSLADLRDDAWVQGPSATSPG